MVEIYLVARVTEGFVTSHEAFTDADEAKKDYAKAESECRAGNSVSWCTQQIDDVYSQSVMDIVIKAKETAQKEALKLKHDLCNARRELDNLLRKFEAARDFLRLII